MKIKNNSCLTCTSSHVLLLYSFKIPPGQAVKHSPKHAHISHQLTTPRSFHRPNNLWGHSNQACAILRFSIHTHCSCVTDTVFLEWHSTVCVVNTETTLSPRLAL